jgi:uncharacterized protein (UPF0332 family)
VSPALTPQSYLDKAERALSDARLLLQAGSTEGACSRAYYAMYDAAHAALRSVGVESANAEIKTHNGLLSRFAQELVRTGRIAGDFSKALNQVQQLRLIADYTAEAPDVERTNWAVSQASAFVAEMTRFSNLAHEDRLPDHT